MGNQNSQDCNKIDLEPSNDFQRLFFSQRPTQELLTEIRQMLQEDATLAKSVTEEREFPCIFIAARCQDPKFVEILLEYGADVNAESSGWCPLHFACAKGHLEMVQTLINKGANVNFDNEGKGGPVVYSAIINGHLEVLKLLQEHGVNINHEGDNGFTLLHLAAKEDQAEICKYLVEQGLDINAQKVDQWTPLMLAAANNRKRAAEALLEFEPNLNMTNNQNKTALYLAVSQNNHKIVRMMLQAGADPNILTHKSKSALRRAKEKEYTKIINALEEYQAEDTGPAPEQTFSSSDLEDNSDFADMLRQLGSGSDSDSKAMVPFEDNSKDELIQQLMADVYMLKHKVAKLEAQINK